MKCYKCGIKLDKDDYYKHRKTKQKLCPKCFEKPIVEISNIIIEENKKIRGAGYYEKK
jgi:hypothetical protein